jgi:hypothetical protein
VSPDPCYEIEANEVQVNGAVQLFGVYPKYLCGKSQPDSSSWKTIVIACVVVVLVLGIIGVLIGIIMFTRKGEKLKSFVRKAAEVQP